MKDEQILTKAIEKAVKNGLSLAQWQHPKIALGDKLHKHRVISVQPPYLSLFWTHNQYKAFDAVENWEVKLSVNDVLFNHDFAKAFWGEKLIDTGLMLDNENDDVVVQKAWEHHLQQMVLEENPISYLEQFLEEK